IGRQVYNLLHGAMVMSASFQRQSVMVACEAVRQADTSAKCSWGTESLYRADAHILLVQLTGKSQFQRRQGNKRRFASGTGTSDISRSDRAREDFYDTS